MQTNKQVSMAKIEEDIQQTQFNNEFVKAHINILYTAHWLYTKINKELKQFELSHEQFNVLRILRGKHPSSLCQKEILIRMIAPTSNLTLIIKRLVAKNLIIVNQSQKDKREYKIRISAEGLRRLKSINKVLSIDNLHLGGLSVEEAQSLSLLLDKLRTDKSEHTFK